ncbi:hypothetical protein F4802DRAFT_174009 [Xylaria palmicola]|nr:hypothetical protein F4802DRAFT_174009 [Xylaria palmicola]
MDGIPPEILYLIFSHLYPGDMPDIRLVNRTFANVGAAYMLPTVSFSLCKAGLDRLEAISLHPIFSKHVLSLTYYADIFDAPLATWRDFVRAHKNNMRWNGKLRRLNLTPSQLMAEYRAYCDAFDQQDRLVEANADMELLKRVLPRFPNLDELTMSAGDHFDDSRFWRPSERPFADFLKMDFRGDAYPEGKRPLDVLLLANAHAPRPLLSFRAGALHWRFFKRSERALARMFSPLVNLTSIELSINVFPADDRIEEGDSLRHCQRALAKGRLRKILKSMPKLECLFIEILNLDSDDELRGASLGDIIEPGFRWPNLKWLFLGGISGERTEFMNFFMQHKDTLETLCLRDITLPSTSWLKFLPDIRNNLCLEEACICGDIFGTPEDEDEGPEPWDVFDVQSFEYWHLSVPEASVSPMRHSIDVYCRRGGELYPDELPLTEGTVVKNYETYVEPCFRDGVDNALDIDGVPVIGPLGDEIWEDISDDELEDDMSDGSMSNGMAAGNAALAVHLFMSAVFGVPPSYYNEYDAEMDDMLDIDDLNADGVAEDVDGDSMGTSRSNHSMEQHDMDSDDEMPELIPQ